MNVEFQIRPRSRSGPPARPPERPPPVTAVSRHLSLDKQLAQGDRLREAGKRLEASLQDIEQSYSSSDQPEHTGQDDCERCAKRKADITQAYYTYYVDPDPESWVSHASPAYRIEMERIFHDPSSSLTDLHATFRKGIREYLNHYLTSGNILSKREVENMFSEDLNTNEILGSSLELLKQRAPNPEAAAFVTELQNTTTPEERAQIYIKYHCSYTWADSSTAKNFKAKYARMFEQLVPYEEVMAAMRKEAKEYQSTKLARLRRQLNELEMAQSAHLKAKARKDQKMRDREPSPGVAQCSLVGCANEVDLATDETIECAVCEWLERKGSEKGRAFYCCVEHAEEDFEEHDRNDHQCCMGARCFYFPQPGPPGETGDGGVCQDCVDEEFTSYFCSQDCYHHNLELHRDDFHMGRGIHNDSDNLEMFQPADDMEMIS